MTDESQPEYDETSRLLPAIPHRSYVYADELVRYKKKKKTKKHNKDFSIRDNYYYE